MEKAHLVLAIDVGNTQTSFGVFKGDDLLKSWRISTNKEETADELAITLQNFLRLAQLSFNNLKGIVISSVVPHVTTSLTEMVEKYFPLKPLIVGPGTKTGIPIMYDNPHEVGADRIANAVAALELYGSPSIVVDFGTATTFDVISKKGEYLGGVIAPGVEISAEALFEKADRLSRVDLEKPPSVIGKNTRTSLQSGIIYGFAGQVDTLIKKIREEIEGKPIVIATGGLSHLMVSACQSIDEHNPNLTLIGLKKIYDKNS